jgi:hypothetical protein
MDTSLMMLESEVFDEFDGKERTAEVHAGI